VGAGGDLLCVFPSHHSASFPVAGAASTVGRAIANWRRPDMRAPGLACDRNRGHRVFMSPASQPPCPPSGLCRGGRQGVGFPPRPPGLLHRRLQLEGSGAQRCRRWGWGGGTRVRSNRQGRGVVMSALMERQWYAISEDGTAAK
jgi:hypothetical protein